VIVRALVSLLALAVLLPVPTRGDFGLVVDMEELACITLLALVLNPMDADCALHFRFILLLIPRVHNHVKLVSALDTLSSLEPALDHGALITSEIRLHF